MMLNRRGVRDSAASPHTRPVSRAQFQSAMCYNPRSSPANRVTRASLTFDDAYSQYENTSSHWLRHSDDVVLPPVHKSPTKTSCTSRRSVRQGPRKLPTVRSDPGVRRTAWYHEDGSLNLQALLSLANKHSFPRTQSYYHRLEKLKNRGWPPAEVNSSPRCDDDRLIPLRFVDDEDLTPRTRSQRDSLLSLLLSSDDLAEHELEQIMRYISDQSDVESTPRSCLRKSSCPKSDKRSKRKKQSPQESYRSKSVHFKHTSTSTCTRGMSVSPQSTPPSGSPRPQSAPSPRTQVHNPISRPRKFSDPFHVASPALSPRALGSPDEVVYFHDMDSPPEIPASPEHIPQPKVTYYDESGEEIEEEIQMKDQANEGSKREGGATAREDAESCPDESPLSDTSRPPLSPVSEVELPDHLAELDTPRVNRDSDDIQRNQQPQHHSTDSTSARPQDHSTMESSPSPRQTVSPRRTSPHEDSPDEIQCTTSVPNDHCLLSESPSEETSHKREENKSSSPVPDTPRPESAPAAEQSSHSNKKSRPKSSKRPKSSRSDSRSTERSEKTSSTDRESKKQSRKPQKRPDASPATRPPPERSQPAKEEPPAIPVFSVIRGQLSAIPPHSPRIQAPESAMLELHPNGDLTDSVQAQHSPRSSTLQGLESADSPGGGRGKDHRMKIWLTRTAWNRHVECPD